MQNIYRLTPDFIQCDAIERLNGIRIIISSQHLVPFLAYTVDIHIHPCINISPNNTN